MAAPTSRCSRPPQVRFACLRFPRRFAPLRPLSGSVRRRCVSTLQEDANGTISHNYFLQHCRAGRLGARFAESKSATADAEFRKMNTNKDGKVSASEHAAGAKQMFETMDGNKDGFLTKDALAAGHARMLKKSSC